MKYMLSVLALFASTTLNAQVCTANDFGLKSVMTELEATEFIAHIGFPNHMKSIKSNGHHLAMVWEYTNRVDGQTLYVITGEDGHVKAMTVSGQTVSVVKQI